MQKDPSFKDRFNIWLGSEAVTYGGIFSALVAVGYASPEIMIGVLGNAAWNAIQGALNSSSSTDPPKGWEELVADEAGFNDLIKDLVENRVEQRLEEALSEMGLEPGPAKEVWNAFGRELRASKEALDKIAADRIGQELLTRPLFKVAVTPLQLERFMAGLRPNEIVARPEIEPIKKFLAKNRMLLLTGPAQSGKTFAGLRLACDWLLEGEERAVAYLNTIPQEWPPLRAMNPDKCLVLFDPEKPLTPEALEPLRNLGAPMVCCFRTGAYAEAEPELFDYLRGSGGFKQARIEEGRLAGAGTRPAWLELGSADEEFINQTFTAIHKVIQREKNLNLTITDQGRAALIERIRISHDGQTAAMLGLARVILRTAAGQGVTQFIPTVLEGITDGLRGDDLIKRIFWGLLDKDAKDVLAVFRLWNSFTGQMTLPRQALEVGYRVQFNGENPAPGIDDLKSLARLTEEEEKLSPWHPLQVEMAKGYVSEDLRDRETWLKASLARLEDYYADAAKPDRVLLKRAESIHHLTTEIIKAGYRNESRLIYEALHRIFLLGNDKKQIVLSANNLGILLKNLGETAEARKLYEEALEVYRELAQESPRAFNPDVATTANNLGNLLSDLGETAEARKLYEEALEIRRGLAQEAPRAYKPYVATTANNLGVLLKDLGETDEARKLYEEALEIYRELAEESPRAFNPDVAMTANNLGILLSDLGETDEARKLYEEALEIRRELAQESPRVFNPDVASTANNLGVLLDDLGETTEARELYEEALGIYRELAREAPRAYKPDVAMTANNLGILLKNLGETTEARELYKEALGIYRELAREAPRAFNPYVAGTANNLGVLLKNLGETAEARKLFEEALEVYRELAQEVPKAFGPKVATVANNLGILLKSIGQEAEAQKYFDEVEEIERELAGLGG